MKGLLFVVLAALLVYFYLLQSLKRIPIDKKRIEMREEIMERILENSGNQFGLFDENGEPLHMIDVLIHF